MITAIIVLLVPLLFAGIIYAIFSAKTDKEKVKDKNRVGRFDISKSLQNLLKPFLSVNTQQYDISINKKPFLQNSLIIWDIENIPIKYFHKIEKFIQYTPEFAYVVSHRALGKKKKVF